MSVYLPLWLSCKHQQICHCKKACRKQEINGLDFNWCSYTDNKCPITDRAWYPFRERELGGGSPVGLPRPSGKGQASSTWYIRRGDRTAANMFDLADELWGL